MQKIIKIRTFRFRKNASNLIDFELKKKYDLFFEIRTSKTFTPFGGL